MEMERRHFASIATNVRTSAITIAMTSAILLTVAGCRATPPPETGIQSTFDYVNWSAPHGDDGNSHFSTLDQINKENVHRLEVAWEYRSGGSEEVGLWWWTGSTIETNPIVIDRILYTATPSMHLP